MDIKTLPEYQTVNSKFPHIGKKLEFLWGNHECRTLLFDLINDRRETDQVGRRHAAGFPFDVAAALLKLISIHDEVYPQFVPKGNIWSDRRYV